MAGSLTRRDRWLPLIPIVLLVLVAFLQIWRAHDLDQSSWAGAGFGMFATYESENTRFVRITSSEGPIAVPESAKDELERLKVVPSDRNMEALATAIREDVAQPADGLTVELYAIDWDPDETTITASVIRSFGSSADGEP